MYLFSSFSQLGRKKFFKINLVLSFDCSITHKQTISISASHTFFIPNTYCGLGQKMKCTEVWAFWTGPSSLLPLFLYFHYIFKNFNRLGFIHTPGEKSWESLKCRGDRCERRMGCLTRIAPLVLKEEELSWPALRPHLSTCRLTDFVQITRSLLKPRCSLLWSGGEYQWAMVNISWGHAMDWASCFTNLIRFGEGEGLFFWFYKKLQPGEVVICLRCFTLMTPGVVLRIKTINFIALNHQACKKHTRNNFCDRCPPMTYNHWPEHFVGIRLLSDIKLLLPHIAYLFDFQNNLWNRLLASLYIWWEG